MQAKSGRRPQPNLEVCEDLKEVKEFFGHRWLAKELYENAGIENVVTIE